MVEQPPLYIAVLTGERLSLVEFFFFVSYFKTHLCNSPKSLMKRFYFASESQLRLMKEAIKVWFPKKSSAHIWVVEGICPFGEPSILSPAKLVQLSIQCFWSINEDSLCSVLHCCTLVTHMQFALDNSRFYAVAYGNQRWLSSSGSHCSSFLVFRFLFFVSFSFLQGRFFI